MVDTQIDNYRIVEKLGEGGMGAVYRATDVMLERDVALKFLRPELARQPELVARFRTEAVVLAKLTHPHIAAVHGLSRHGDDLFMVMEYVRGETLEAVLEREHRLALERAVAIAGMVLQALEYAHREGVVHRDVKPANIMICPGGDVKVMDFGIARVLGAQRRTRTGFVVGTAGYMAPEQIQGHTIDGRADLYSLGIVLYEMVTGRAPFDADTEWALMQAQVNDPPEPPRVFAEMPVAVEAAVLKALEKAPANRYQTAREFERGLVDLLPGAAASAGSVPPTRIASADVAARPGPTREAAARATPPAWAVPAPTRLARGVGEASTPSSAATPAVGGARLAVSWRQAVGIAALLALVVGAVLIGRIVLRGPALPVEEARVTPLPASTDAPPAAALQASPLVEAPLPSAVSPVAPRADLPPITNEPGAPPRSSPPVMPRVLAPIAPGPGRVGTPRPQPEAPAAPKETTPVAPEPLAEPAAPVVREEPAAPAATEAPPPPSPGPPGGGAGAATAPVSRFDKVKLLQSADGKVREVDAVLELRSDGLVVLDRNGLTPLKTMGYSQIRGATYAQSKHPRWKEGAGVAVVVGVFAAPIFFMKGTKHWFTVQSPDDYVVLRLDKNNYRLVIPAFETRSGRGVEVAQEEK